MGGVQVSYGKLVHWVTGISLGIGLLVLLNQLQIPYYLYYPRTTQTMLISYSYDYFIFLISTVSVPLTFALSWRKFSTPVSVGMVSIWGVAGALVIPNPAVAVPILYAVVICAAALGVLRSEGRRVAVTEILPSALVVLVLVEWSSLFYFVAAALNPHGGAVMLPAKLEADLTFSLYPAAIPIMLLLLFSWLWVPLIQRLSRRRGRLLVRYQPPPRKPDLRTVVAALDLFAIVAVIVFFYPYLAGQTWVVGQDSYWNYINPLNGINGLTVSQAFNTALYHGASPYHGAYVVFLYIIQLASGLTSVSIVKYAPLPLSFFTAVAVFFAAQRAGWNLQLSILASISTLLWLPTTLGIYVAIQANWLALLVWMIFLAVYFSGTERTITTYLVLAVLSLIILLLHPWTWGVFVATLLFTAIISRRNTWAKHCTRALGASLVLALPVGILAYVFSPNLRSIFLDTLQLYSSGPANPAGLLNFGGALMNLFANLGPALSPTILLISLLGAYTLSRRRDMTANYILAWMAAACIGSILVAPSGFTPTNPGFSETGIWRVLYDSPLPFLLALGLEKCISISRRSMTLSSLNSSESILSRVIPLFSMVPFVVTGAGLFMFWDSNVRLLLVIAALILALLLIVMLPNYRTLDVLVVSLLALILFNAAFRTLFPLVLDPHSIFVPPGTTR
jgi:hypothetical protein